MKKDLIFAPVMLVIGALLFLLRATGMTAHIIISVVGVAVLVAYAVLTKKEWRLPALEVLMRVFYGLALVSGVVMMKLFSVAAIAVMHKLFAGLFLVLLLVLLVYKLVSAKKE